VSSRGVYLEPSTNSVVEYNAIIDLLRDTISHGVRYLEFLLDSHLVVFQLDDTYQIRYPTLLRCFLQVRLLEQYFDFITYNHIPRSSNQVSNAFSN
jgi:ribonuclease HI